MSRYAPHRPSTRPASSSTVCQKCLKTGHFIYECKSERPYVSRPSRTQQLENPNALAKLKAAGKPSVEVPEEFKKKDGTANRILEEKAKEREKGKERESKRAKRSSSSSDSDSGSDSDSSSSSSSESSDSGSRSSSSNRSRERDRKRRVPTRRDRSRSDSR
ncbi:SHSP domain-containing protein [Favolaschia claudopus]|uniref:SHSP domain-containing protein n=1 Tax=Favolaschia claudopus TaxID=2862362 RepID=A0AAW0D9X3_9AGAR